MDDITRPRGKEKGDYWKDVICCDCGVLLKNVYVNTKRCPECNAINARRLRNRWNHLTGRRQPLPPAIPVLDHKYCEGCEYFGGDMYVNKCCNYIFIVGHRRPCPPGKDCTVKVKRSKKYG